MSFSPQPSTQTEHPSFGDFQQLQEINLELFQTLLNAFCHQTSHYDSQNECKACSVIIKNIKYMSESINNLSDIYHNSINSNSHNVSREQDLSNSIIPIKKQEDRHTDKALNDNNVTSENTNLYLCYNCYAQYETEYGLNRHKKVCGEAKQSEYYCHTCLKNFKTKRTIVKHEKTDEHINRKLRRLYHTPKRDNPSTITTSHIVKESMKDMDSSMVRSNQISAETKLDSDFNLLHQSATTTDLSHNNITKPAQSNPYYLRLSESSESETDNSSETENSSDTNTSLQSTLIETEKRDSLLPSTNIKPQPYVIYPDW